MRSEETIKSLFSSHSHSNFLNFKHIITSSLTYIFSLLPTAYCLLPIASNAYTRVKTVEFNFGGYYSATNVAAWTPPYITINLPDAIATSPIKDAVLDIQYQSVPFATNRNSPTTAIDVRFSTGTAAGGATILTIGPGALIPSSTQKNDIMCLRFDIASKMIIFLSSFFGCKSLNLLLFHQLVYPFHTSRFCNQCQI